MITTMIQVLRTLAPTLVILEGCGATSTTDGVTTPLKIAMIVYATYAIKQLTMRH